MKSFLKWLMSLLHWLLGNNQGRLTTLRRATHTYVVGQPGTGKSRAIESWVMQDIAAGHGVGVIDPHGELFRNLVYRLSSMPQDWNRVVIIDPCNPKWTVSFNPLEAIEGFSQERLALFLTDVVVHIWKLNIADSPRLIWLLTNTFLALSGLGLSLLDLPRFLLDDNFRESLIPQISHEGARLYFLHEFPTKQGEIRQWVTPVLNKIGSLIFDADLRLILAGHSTINFRKIMDNRLILLVNLPKGIIGEGQSALMAAFIVTHLQKAALSRVNNHYYPPFYFYLDEFQNYTTANIKDILSESRKYAFSLILAHQYLDQLEPDLRSAVLNTAGTIISFRVGFQDAYNLAKEIFPSPDFLKVVERIYRIRRIAGLTLPTVRERLHPMGWEGLAQEITKLSQREFWCRQRGVYLPTKHRTFDMPDPVLTADVIANRGELFDVSGRRYGKLKESVRQELEKIGTRFDPRSNGKHSATEAEITGTDIPLWGN